jgi:F-box protein 21
MFPSASDRSKRYVAEENIQPLHSEPSAVIMKLAGQYFKRWDPDSQMFISNIKDEYPDD